MIDSLTQTLRSRGFAVTMHLTLWVLLVLAVTGIRGKAPELREAESAPSLPQSPAPVARLEELFNSGAKPTILTRTNLLNPFYTTQFIPPQTPIAPAPTTRKIDLTYLGYYQTAGGPEQVMVRMGDTFLVAAPGKKLTSNLFAARATMQLLTLTNTSAQTNLLPLNVKKELEVPIQ